MRPVKAKFEDKKLCIFKSVESLHALLQEHGCPLDNKGEGNRNKIPLSCRAQ